MTTLRDIEVELVLDSRSDLGEGPFWDERTNTLVWVDLTVGDVHRFDPQSGEDSVLARLGMPVGAAVLCQADGMMLAVPDGFLRLADDGSTALVAAVEADDPSHRMNDGKCDSSGRFWAGTNSYTFVPGESTLWRLDAAGTVEAAATGLTLANGMGWSPDDTTMYLIDSFQYRVEAFDYDPESGALSRRRTLIAFDEAAGLPDGMTVDAEGYLWIAMYSGSAVRRYAPDGSLDQVVRMPVSQPTSCAFGGPDLQDLYITTGNQLLSAAEVAAQPTLGGLFRCRPGVTGLPSHRYAG